MVKAKNITRFKKGDVAVFTEDYINNRVGDTIRVRTVVEATDYNDGQLINDLVFAKRLKLKEKKVVKSFHNLKVGDILYNKITGSPVKIKHVEIQLAEESSWYGVGAIREEVTPLDKSFTLDKPKFPKAKELTLAQIAKKFDIPLNQLRIKEKK